MKSSNVSPLFSRVLVCTLVLSLLSVQTAMAFALPGGASSAAEITVSGNGSGGGDKPFVVVNGDRAFSGRTFFSDGNVETTDSSSATLNLGKLGRINLAPSSALTLSFADGRISGVLSKGSVSVSNMEGVAVNIDTATDSIRNEGTSASRFTVGVVDGKTGFSVESGNVLSNTGLAKQDDDDDDDDDHWKAWVWVGVIGGIIGTIIIWKALDDDDDVVSPVR